MAVLLIFLALIASSAANAWTHPTSRRSGAARLLGLGEAWEADPEGGGDRGRRGGWGPSGWSGLAGAGELDGVPLGAGPGAGPGAGVGAHRSWPWPQPAQAQQDQQLVNAVGGLGKRHGAPRGGRAAGEDAASATTSTTASSTRSTAPSPAIFTALGSVGVLSDLSSFFSNLQDNLESMENMTPEERRMVLGGVDSPHEMLPQAGPGRPMSAPALMTSLRNQRPSSRTRHFVETSEPAALRRSNNHDPQVLWAGLGR